MSTESSFSQSGQRAARGFPPLFRGVHSDQHLRVSDAERQAVVDRLAEHFAQGRLDQAEFDERSARAMTAKTRGDLAGLFDDLPETGAPAVPEHPWPGRRRRHPVLLLVLPAVMLILALSHGLAFAAWDTVWWLWLGVLALVLLLATGTIGHCHPSQDR